MSSENLLEPLTTTALVRREANRGRVEAADIGMGRPFAYHNILAGILVIIFLVSFVSFWVSFAPISSAVVSPGVITVPGNRKTVQHLEGGIVDEILVQDGDIVTRGQALIKLRQVEPEANLAQLEARQLETAAVIERLLAEQTGADRVKVPEEYTGGRSESLVTSIIEGQQRILETSRDLLQQRMSLLKERMAQNDEEILGIREQIKAGELQRKLLLEEISQLSILAEKGLLSRTRLLARRQELAAVEGDLGVFRSELARINKEISETQLQISELQAAEFARTTKQLREERARFFDISQRLKSARDVLSRTTITAPTDGEVVNLQVNSTNAVIRPGQPTMDIMPLGDQLIVKAFVNPNDIDEVREGMSADIKLQSETRRNRIPIEGLVSHVSPDRLIDTQTGRAYYEAHIQIPQIEGGAETKVVLAGMSANVFIRTGDRTALDYLFEPILRNIDLGFREK